MLLTARNDCIAAPWSMVVVSLEPGYHIPVRCIELTGGRMERWQSLPLSGRAPATGTAAAPARKPLSWTVRTGWYNQQTLLLDSKGSFPAPHRVRHPGPAETSTCTPRTLRRPFFPLSFWTAASVMRHSGRKPQPTLMSRSRPQQARTIRQPLPGSPERYLRLTPLPPQAESNMGCPLRRTPAAFSPAHPAGWRQRNRSVQWRSVSTLSSMAVGYESGAPGARRIDTTPLLLESGRRTCAASDAAKPPSAGLNIAPAKGSPAPCLQK